MKNESKLTWKDVVKEALLEIGNSGHLDDIYSKINGHPKTETNPTWRDTVRRTLQQYSIFYQEEKGSGIWYLREEKPLEEFDPKKNPNPGHEDVQGMLLEPGKIYGYETWKGVNDAKRKLMGGPLEEITKMDEVYVKCIEEGEQRITKSLSISKVNNKTYGIFEQYRFED
jgi:hypothetical protein